MNRVAATSVLFAAALSLIPAFAAAEETVTTTGRAAAGTAPGTPVRLAGWLDDGMSWLFGTNEGARKGASTRSKASLKRPNTAIIEEPPEPQVRAAGERPGIRSDDAADPLSVLATGLQSDTGASDLESLLDRDVPDFTAGSGDPIAGLLDGSTARPNVFEAHRQPPAPAHAVPDPIGAALGGGVSGAKTGIAGVLSHMTEGSPGRPRAKPARPISVFDPAAGTDQRAEAGPERIEHLLLPER